MPVQVKDLLPVDNPPTYNFEVPEGIDNIDQSDIDAITLFRMELRASNDILYFADAILGVDWLYPKQKKILKEYVEGGYIELVFVGGMRGGKSMLAAIYQAWETFKLLTLGTPNAFYGLPTGSEIFIINVASSGQQSKDTIFAHYKARIHDSWWFDKRNYTERHNEFEFPTGDGVVKVRSEHSNSASLAGKTVKCVLFDEISRFKDTGGPGSAQMVYDTLSRATKTFGKERRIVSVSSPIFVGDFQMKWYRDGLRSMELHNGKGPILAYKCATWEMNPNITREDLEPEFRRNYEAAMRDFGAEPSEALEQYYGRVGLIDEAARTDLRNWIYLGLNIMDKRLEEYNYVLAGDPALKQDSFGLALGHFGELDGKRMFIFDMIYRFTPEEGIEIDANVVKEFILTIVKNVNVRLFVTDIWNYPETLQAIRDTGVGVEQHFVKKEEHDTLKEGVYNRDVAYAWEGTEDFREELTKLELVRGKKVDHPRDGSKDMADAAANCYWHARERYGTMQEPVIMFVEE